MKIIISPAKKMVLDDSLDPRTKPVFLEEAKRLLSQLQTMTYAQLKKLWATSDKLTQENLDRLKDLDLDRAYSPAVLTYQGLQYQYMGPGVLTGDQMAYIQDHLRILSGLYGVLKPFDGVAPYRLEMQAKLKVDGHKNLYSFWGDKIYREVLDEDRTLVNLASVEYAKAITPYLKGGDVFISPLFGRLVDGSFKQQASQAKMARGEMVRFMAEEGVKAPEEIKAFNRLGYSYRQDLSTKDTWRFVKD